MLSRYHLIYPPKRIAPFRRTALCRRSASPCNGRDSGVAYRQFQTNHCRLFFRYAVSAKARRSVYTTTSLSEICHWHISPCLTKKSLGKSYSVTLSASGSQGNFLRASPTGFHLPRLSVRFCAAYFSCSLPFCIMIAYHSMMDG